jgi:hypothetical protein
MSSINRAAIVLELLSFSPAMLGLVSPQGECLFVHGALKSQEALTNSASVPLSLKELFPFISSDNDFWQSTLLRVSRDNSPSYFHHTLASLTLLVVLFPCPVIGQPDSTKEGGIGLLALETLHTTPNALLRNERDPFFPEHMISVVGHELRNPLFSLGAGIRILETVPFPTTSMEWVTSMMQRRVGTISVTLTKFSCDCSIGR